MFVVVEKKFLRYIKTAQGCRNKQLKIGGTIIVLQTFFEVTDIFCIYSSNQNSAKCLQGMHMYLENKKVSVLSLWNSLEIQCNETCDRHDSYDRKMFHRKFPCGQFSFNE